MRNIHIRANGEANSFALLEEGMTMPGEVLANGHFTVDRQEELVAYAANLLTGRFPIAPNNAKWELRSLDEPNRLTLVSYTNNQPIWLLVLTVHRPIAIPGLGVCEAVEYEARL